MVLQTQGREEFQIKATSPECGGLSLRKRDRKDYILGGTTAAMKLAGSKKGFEMRLSLL
jgi:hypothetical protein